MISRCGARNWSMKSVIGGLISRSRAPSRAHRLHGQKFRAQVFGVDVPHLPCVVARVISHLYPLFRLKKGDPCPPPALPKLYRLYEGVRRVLESNVVLQICAVTLRRALDVSDSKSKYILESHIHKV